MSAGEKIFWSFIILFLSVLMAFLPIGSAAYAFKTDSRTDSYSVVTGIGETTGNITLRKTLYENNTGTISFLSAYGGDIPVMTSYNTTTRVLLFNGLSDNTSRIIDITYDTVAVGTEGAIATIIDKFTTPVWIMFAILFPLIGFTSIFILSRRS